MKNLIIVLFLLIPLKARADATICDEKILMNKKNEQAVRFLEPFQGRYKFGECKIEFHVCDINKPEANRGSLVGDILIIDRHGQENYVPIILPSEPTPKISVNINQNRVMFNYFLADRIPDPISGNLEEYRLEVLRNWSAPGLSQITMGTYTSKRDLGHIDKYTYRWSECFSNTHLDSNLGESITP